MTVQTASIAVEAYKPHAEALAKLRGLQERLPAAEAALEEASQKDKELAGAAITLEAAGLVGEADARAVQAARAKSEQAAAAVTEARRRLHVIREAVRQQEERLKALLPEAREYVKRAGRVLDEPLWQDILQHLYAAAVKLQEREAIKLAVTQALGGAYGVLPDPRIPEITLDKVQGGALIYGTVDNIARALREEGYNVEVRGGRS